MLNGVWPVILCLYLIISCCTQILLCFGRDKVSTCDGDYKLLLLFPFHQVHITDVNHSLADGRVKCEKHLLTSYLIPDSLLLIAYLYSLYIFRRALPEHLSTLVETVSCAFEEYFVYECYSSKCHHEVYFYKIMGMS